MALASLSGLLSGAVSAQVTSSVELTSYVDKVTSLPGSDSLVGLVGHTLVGVDARGDSWTTNPLGAVTYSETRGQTLVHDYVVDDAGTLYAVTSHSFALDAVVPDSLFLAVIAGDTLVRETLLSTEATRAADVYRYPDGEVAVTAMYIQPAEPFTEREIRVEAFFVRGAGEIDTLASGVLALGAQDVPLHDLELGPAGGRDLFLAVGNAHVVISRERRAVTLSRPIDGVYGLFFSGDTLYDVSGHFEDALGFTDLVSGRRIEGPEPLASRPDWPRFAYAAGPSGRMLAYRDGGDTAYHWRFGEATAEAIEWYDAPYQRARFAPSQRGSGRASLLFTAAYHREELDQFDAGVDLGGGTSGFSRATFLLRGPDLASLYAPRASPSLALSLPRHTSERRAFEPTGEVLYDHDFDVLATVEQAGGLPVSLSAVVGTGPGGVFALSPRSTDTIRAGRVDYVTTTTDTVSVTAYLLHAGFFPPGAYTSAIVTDAGTSGLVDAALTGTVDVAPNPTTDWVALSSEHIDLGALQWSLHDLSGRTVGLTSRAMTPSRVEFTFEGLARGSYLLRGASAAGTLVRRIVVR